MARHFGEYNRCGNLTRNPPYDCGSAKLVEYTNTDRQIDVTFWRRLVYQAIASLDEEGSVPVLEEIYPQIKNDLAQLGNFYWTIEPMQSPGGIQWRDKIGKEVGIEPLIPFRNRVDSPPQNSLRDFPVQE